MKASSFEYVCPSSLAQAVELLATYGDDAKILAGGQSLIAALNMRLSTPSVLIDIGNIDELKGIEALADGGVRIGALARHAEVARSSLIAQRSPLIAKAIQHVAHPAIRNRGTFAGSLANADPAAELPACVVALDATIHCVGKAGKREIAATEFFTGLFETLLSEREIITHVTLPALAPTARSSFGELARRDGDYALCGLAARCDVNEEQQAEAFRLVYFSMGPCPMRASGAEEVLNNATVFDRDVLRGAQSALEGDLDPPSDLNASGEYRMKLAKVLLARAMAEIAQGRPSHGRVLNG